MPPLLSIVVLDCVHKLFLSLIVFDTYYYSRIPAFGSVGQSAVAVHFVVNTERRQCLGVRGADRAVNVVIIIDIVVGNRRQRPAMGGAVALETFVRVKH